MDHPIASLFTPVSPSLGLYAILATRVTKVTMGIGDVFAVGELLGANAAMPGMAINLAHHTPWLASLWHVKDIDLPMLGFDNGVLFRFVYLVIFSGLFNQELNLIDW